MSEGVKKKGNFFGCNSFLIKNSRGLSAVVTTMIIVLLSIVAVTTVWVVINNLITEGSEDITLDQFTLDLAIKNAYVDGSDIRVSIRRSVGKGEILGLNFVFSDGSNSKVVRRDIALDELEEATFVFIPSEISGIVAGNTVSVAPIFDSSGKEKVGSVTDTEEISNIVPGGGDPPGGGASGTCGDGNIQNPNGEVPPINEQCDGANLGGQTCGGLGLGTGPLSCTGGCQFDTSSCSGGTPPTCGNGVFDTGLEECDGTPTPNGCSAGTCTCDTGFNADGSGGCNLDPPINTGTINSVWNRIFLDSHDLPKSQVAMVDYIGYYTNFSGSPEIACFRINFASYVTETDISYMRLDDSLGFPNVAGGEGYSVWEAVNCGA